MLPVGQFGRGERSQGIARFASVRHVWVEFKPKHPRYAQRINASVSPPCHFVTAAVDFAVMPATQRNNELITYFAG
jgi:hypothetical protein